MKAAAGILAAHGLRAFWGSYSKTNGVSCRKCGATWLHRRRYTRSVRGKRRPVSRLVLTTQARIEKT